MRVFVIFSNTEVSYYPEHNNGLNGTVVFVSLIFRLSVRISVSCFLCFAFFFLLSLFCLVFIQLGGSGNYIDADLSSQGKLVAVHVFLPTYKSACVLILGPRRRNV